MATLKISWTTTAKLQRDLIFDYWNKRNKSYVYSRKLYFEILERIAILKQNPEIGKPTTFNNTRAISLGHYSIFYKVGTTQLIITAFWDNRQDSSKLKKLLKP
ncbi:type II toxin-antitoxin system RelE/ParE family toxin [Flavobacterium sp. LaA7.5]|nr:type II toxin-antitoxin system RelE/ParE family toxin [Flavobacterium salilacus subsp. altitudinum]